MLKLVTQVPSSLLLLPFIIGLSLLWPGLGNSWFSRIEAWFQALARRRILTALLLALLPIVLRLTLLPIEGVPVPHIHDEFGHLLIADTLLHGRLANPPHPNPEFFETIYVIQRPTYSSNYPIGIGISLAIGQLLFGHPWGGVLLFVSLMCAGVYWMLLQWTTPGWALIGGLITIMSWGVLSEWASSYCGGAAAAVAGCAIIGALPRTFDKSKPIYAVVFGFGLSYSFLIRPFETLLIVPCVVVFVLLHRETMREIRFQRTLLFISLGLAPGVLLTALHDHAVTGKYSELPYVLNRKQYGAPQTFSFQPASVPQHPLTHEQQAVYEWQKEAHDKVASFRGFLDVLPSRIAVVRLYLASTLWPLLFILPFCRMDRRLIWIIGSIAFMAIGGSLYGFFLPQYVAPFIGFFLLLGIAAMQRLNEFEWGRLTVRLFLVITFCHFAALFGLSMARGLAPSAARLTGRPVVVTQTPRSSALKRLTKEGGNQLVFVAYGARHSFYNEWVWNAADIDSSRIIWARDLGPENDARLMTFYPGRSVWRADVGGGEAKLTRLR